MVVKVVMVVMAVVVIVMASMNVTAPRQGCWLAIATALGSGSVVVVLPRQILPLTRCPLDVAVTVTLAIVVCLAVAREDGKQAVVVVIVMVVALGGGCKEA